MTNHLGVHMGDFRNDLLQDCSSYLLKCPEFIAYAGDSEFQSSVRANRRILVKNSLGYSWIEISGATPFEITPEFLDQFEFYSMNFEKSGR